jgi:hypothetical protein
MLNQETIALGIVGIATFYVFFQVFKKYLAELLARWLLRHGRVKWAMLCRKIALPKSGCDNCSCH